jgi:DNA-binding MarR family transcriptional regulator
MQRGPKFRDRPTSPSRLAVLAVLEMAGLRGMYTKDIAASCRQDPKDVSRMLHSMMRDGLVQRSKAGGNHRPFGTTNARKWRLKPPEEKTA